MTDPDKLMGRMGNRMFQHAFLYSKFLEGEIPDIYLQDPKYFNNHEKEIKALYGQDIGYLPYVSIHVRRGDYVGNPFYTQLWETGYYIDAINEFPGRKFLVFSDDIEFCKRYFEGDRFAFDDSANGLEAFNRMSSCESHIISNSSYSWWSAYLSPSLTKKVVAPTVDKWFSDGIERTVCPPEWIRI